MEIMVLGIALLLGVLAGIVTGLTPGVHVNLVAVIVVGLAGHLAGLVPLMALAVFLISVAITHTFLDSIPCIYLGAPDEAQALNVLPGHRMLKRGEGHTAVLYTVLGSLGALLLGLFLFPLFVLSMKWVSPLMSGIMGYALAVIMLYMIGKEKGKRLKSLAVFLLAGVLGLMVLTSLPGMEQPLLPLLSGLFGFSILIPSMMQRSAIPPQHAGKPLAISNMNAGKAISAASGMGFVAAFLPGFGNAQAAIIATNIVGDIGDEGFLTLVGGINTANSRF